LKPSRNRVVVPARQTNQAGGVGSLESILGLLNSLKIRALGRKYQHDLMYLLQSIYSDKQLPQSSFTGVFFLDDGILLWCLYS
jgi:hypothetical protein